MAAARISVQAPRSIQAALALILAGTILVPLTIAVAEPGLAAFSVVFNLLLAISLVRRSTAAWWLLIFTASLALLLTVSDHEAWWLGARSLVIAALVLMPASLHYVFETGGRSRTDACPFGPREDSDISRPSAWHLDPSDPSRMSHWSRADRSWSSVTRTPRRLRRAIREYGLDQPRY